MTDTIYVIDDDKDLRESIAEILEANNFSVKTFRTAEESLSEIKSDPPALVIVDNMMPGMGGMALIAILKKDHPQLKIIMITAFSTVENAVSSMRIGADDYLEKPFRRDALLATVRRNLETRKFEKHIAGPELNNALACLSNQIRRQILTILTDKTKLRFMDITRCLGIKDHTKVNFHLKNLKSNNFVTQNDDKFYTLTPQGQKIVECLDELSSKITGNQNRL